MSEFTVGLRHLFAPHDVQVEPGCAWRGDCPERSVGDVQIEHAGLRELQVAIYEGDHPLTALRRALEAAELVQIALQTGPVQLINGLPVIVAPASQHDAAPRSRGVYLDEPPC